MNPIMFNKMPTVNLDAMALTTKQSEIVSQIVSKNKSGTYIRTVKPENGIAAYIWRMVIMVAGNNKKYHGNPISAEYYIPHDAYKHRTEKYTGKTRGMSKELKMSYHARAKLNAYIEIELDPIVDEILFNITGRTMKTERKNLLAYLQMKYFCIAEMNKTLRKYRSTL